MSNFRGVIFRGGWFSSPFSCLAQKDHSQPRLLEAKKHLEAPHNSTQTLNLPGGCGSLVPVVKNPPEISKSIFRVGGLKFQPIWTKIIYIVKLDHFSKWGWKQKKYLKPPPRKTIHSLKLTFRTWKGGVEDDLSLQNGSKWHLFGCYVGLTEGM